MTVVDLGRDDDQFAAMFRSAGLRIPAGWEAGTLAVCRELRVMSATIRRPRPAESEPGHVFILDAVLRDLETP